MPSRSTEAFIPGSLSSNGHSPPADREKLQLHCQLPLGFSAIQRALIDGVPDFVCLTTPPKNPEDQVAKCFAVLGIDRKAFDELSDGQKATALFQGKRALQAEIEAGRAEPQDLTPRAAELTLRNVLGLNNTRHGLHL